MNFLHKTDLGLALWQLYFQHRSFGCMAFYKFKCPYDPRPIVLIQRDRQRRPDVLRNISHRPIALL